MLKIRLRRSGKKNHAQYRIVVAEHTAPIQGKFIDLVGSYDPHTKVVNVKKDLVLEWVNKGALPTNTVAKLLNSVKIAHKNIVYIKKTSKISKQEPQEETKVEKAAENTEEVKTQDKVDLKETEVKEEPVQA